MRGTYHIWTSGCQMNAADSRRLAEDLDALGFRPCPHAETADIAILNTCVVRQQPEERAYGRIHSLKAAKRRRPDMLLAVMGCLVGQGEDEALCRRFPYVDVFLPPSDPTPLLEMVRKRVPEDTGRATGPGCRVAAALPAAVAVNVPAVLGCSFGCAYCVIPSRRGPERSRAAEGILGDCRDLVARGTREITLLGQIIDRYGMDRSDGITLPDLLRSTAALEGLSRLRFLTSHPCWFDEGLLDAVAEGPPLCPYFEIAVQSGSDEVLRRMRRGYRADDFRRLADRIRARLPDAALYTDVIVGFPDETESQFMETCRLLEDVRFGMVRVAKYSPRPRTPAIRLYTDNVPPEEKERRRKAIEELQTGIQEKTNQSLLGSGVEVLAEEKRGDRWKGRTPHNRLVYFEADHVDPGDLVHVRIDWTGPFTLVGKRMG